MAVENKNILICISGGIAAYKIISLVRILKKSGAEVQVLLTPSAEDFVPPLTLSALSGRPVLQDFSGENSTWNNHVDLALWADVILMAPCTANTLAKMVHGLCDNLVMATYMSAKCPVFVAPAMDLDMYAHFSTRQNLELLEEHGHFIIPAETGELASGLHGQGRMAEPETLFEHLRSFFKSAQQTNSGFFAGKKVLITAGPTYEAIDPVRFIGNYSTGKMGYALAEEAAELGAQVVLIAGPGNLHAKHPNITVFKVTAAREMFDQVFQHFDQMDIAIASAAVADYAPKTVAEQKIKKNEDALSIELVKNPDILKVMGERKKHQFLVGFALETENEEENAKSKFVRKNLDMIVLNSLRDAGAGFGGDQNKVKIFTRNGTEKNDLKSKAETAGDILNAIERSFGRRD